MDITDLESSDKVKTLYVSIYGIENAYRQGFLGSGYPGYQNQDIVLDGLIIMVNSRQANTRLRSVFDRGRSLF